MAGPFPGGCGGKSCRPFCLFFFVLSVRLTFVLEEWEARSGLEDPRVESQEPDPETKSTNKNLFNSRSQR